MNENGQSEENSWCHFHPKQVVVGVCPLCLNERLLILASKQDHCASTSSHRLQSSIHRKPLASSIHKIFALGFLFNRPESQQLKSENCDDLDSSPSSEDSFISIKFEENGMASWEKNPVSNKVTVECDKKVCWNHHSQIPNKDIKETKSVIEHGKKYYAIRWRKRVGHLFHLMQWKRSTKGGVCRVGSKVEVRKVRKGRMRTLTKRMTMD